MKRRLWTEKELREAVKASFSFRKVLEKIGLKESGGNYLQIKKYIKELDINIGHFKGRSWNKGMKGTGGPKIPLEDILIKNSSFQSFKLKNRLLKEGLKPMFCEECGWKEVSRDGRLPLEIHHINGDPHDNRLSNLVILCPNCHSLKPNYRGRNSKK